MAIEAGGNPDAKLAVPKNYTNIATTPLIVNTDDSPFAIKVPKPSASPPR